VNGDPHEGGTSELVLKVQVGAHIGDHLEQPQCGLLGRLVKCGAVWHA
jgi:hypothetical protein